MAQITNIGGLNFISLVSSMSTQSGVKFEPFLFHVMSEQKVAKKCMKNILYHISSRREIQNLNVTSTNGKLEVGRKKNFKRQNKIHTQNIQVVLVFWLTHMGDYDLKTHIQEKFIERKKMYMHYRQAIKIKSCAEIQLFNLLW